MVGTKSVIARIGLSGHKMHAGGHLNGCLISFDETPQPVEPYIATIMRDTATAKKHSRGM